MGRQRNRAKRAEAGLKNDSYKSKTSASFIKYRHRREEQHAIGHAYPRRHSKRIALHAQLTKELGLPLDTKFIFRYSLDDLPEGHEHAPIIIYFGTTVVINKKDLGLVLASRCTLFKDMTPLLRKTMDKAISLPFLHVRSRNKCTTNHSITPLTKAGLYWGWLGACGWRGGCDTGKSIGHYSLNAFTSGKDSRVEDDRIRMTKMHEIRDIWAERFATLSLSTFETNKQLALDANVPGLDDLEWQHTPNGKVFASSLVMTCDDFYNVTHTDLDHTRHAFGITCLVERQTGKPYELEGSPAKGRAMGGDFIIEKFGVRVSPERVDGTTELIWDTKIPHRTMPCISIDADGHKVQNPDKTLVTRFGSSCQISESLVARINLLDEKKGKMTSEEWANHRASRVKGYNEETARKLMKLMEKDEKAKAKREAPSKASVKK